MRLSLFARRTLQKRRVLYPLLGAMLSLGAPLGLVAVRAVATGKEWDYAYGWLLGYKEDQLEERSATDELTGLGNRRQLASRAREELLRARRDGKPTSLLLVDVDRLKAINDTLGHQAGDEALRLVAEALRRSCRHTDLPARIGGDEFAVLLPATNVSSARVLGARIHDTLRTLARRDPGEPPDVTVSIGGADALPVADASLEALYRAADSALYQAKAEGGDGVTVVEHGAADAVVAPATATV
jgi:diguanylate cyclase (GGDEF)-like protein